VSKFLENLAAELERARELSPRVLNYVGGTYNIDHDAIGAFLVDELPKLEDYELDLILSPVFTPKLTDQAVFAELLGGESIPRESFPELVQQLVARPTRARLITPDGQGHFVDLRAVTIERYVHRLRLEGSISESLFGLIDRVSAAAERPMLKAIARRAVWESEGARQILVRYLTNAAERGKYSLEDAADLLALVEGRKPVDLSDLLARMSGWQEALREQINVGSGGKPFFNEDIRSMHGEDRDQRQSADVRLSAKERELEFLIRLEQVLGNSGTVA
jgi:hypothetical protein